MRVDSPGALALIVSKLGIVALLACGVVRPLAGAEDAARLFIGTIQPTLKEKCLGCHGEANTFGKLDLRTRQAALQGGGRGPAVAPGDPAASLLLAALESKSDLKMPPGEDAKLPESTIDVFRRWIAGGAPYATAKAQGFDWSKYKEEDLWAFRSLQKVAPPKEGFDPARARTPVDAFILRKLSEEGLKPAPRADRRTLIRRATFDLSGLPPTPEEVRAFLYDPAPEDQAFKKVVERLLASPRYGERWGRRWLDVVRYADTAGFSNDFERPNAWRYRDYVIRAFNNDKPYDRFILEQIAGDELFPDDPEALIALGFLRSGPWEHTAMSVAAVTRQLFLDDVTHSVGVTFLAMTLGCAKCHDHKFDPLPQKDYYRMQAVFATTAFARRRVPFLEVENREGVESGKRRMREVIGATQAKLNRYVRMGKARVMKQYGVDRPSDLPAAVRKKSGLTPEEREARKLYGKHLSMYRESALRYEPFAFSVSSGLIPEWNDVGPNGASSYLKKADYAKAGTHVLEGGSIEAPGEAVSPGTLTAVERYSGYRGPKTAETVAGRRAALAKWIAHPDNPLTARVMVNRLWQYHFGRGLAEEANNFGKMGEPPSHPELLDWLAAFFIERGWSVKAVHRVILLSDAYQRASEPTDPEAVEKKDPRNKLLSYVSPRRLEAEALRDSMLAVAGELSPSAGGPGTFPQINRELAVQSRHAMGSLRPVYYHSPEKRYRNRRSIYSFTARSLVDPLIETFNGPSLDLSCSRRDSTTVPTQAFALFNSEVSYDLATAFAARLAGERADVEGRVERAFELAYGRPPDERERAAAIGHVEEMTAYHRRTPPPAKPKLEAVKRFITSELTGEAFPFIEEPPPWEFEQNLHLSDLAPETRALADLALVLFNSNEFVYVY